MGDSGGFRRPLVSEEGPERSPDVEEGIQSEVPHQNESQSASPAVQLVGIHHKTSTAYFVLGFFFLPFVWLINFSMFRPYVYNPEAVATPEEQIDIGEKATTIRRRATMSITGAWVVTVLLAVWAVTFQICARWYPTNWTKALTMTCPSAISHLG